jgi:hypothetical protein
MEIFFLQYESVPSSKSEDFNDIGGAYINCWIKANSLAGAKKLAESNIKDNEWVIIKLEESYPVNMDFYENNDEFLQYFLQAEIDDEVYVYHSWPNEPQDGENIH